MVNPDLGIRGEGGGSSRPLDKGWAGLQKNFFGPFGPQFGLEIRWGGGVPRAPPLDPPLNLASPFRPLAGTGNGNFIYRRFILQVHSHSSIEKPTS